MWYTISAIEILK